MNLQELKLKDLRLEDLIDEKTMFEILGCVKSQMAYLRNQEHFPFVRVSRNLRVYLAQDVLAWLIDRRSINNWSELEVAGDVIEGADVID